MHLEVIWRWRYVVVAGLGLAVVLTFFSFFSVSFAHGFKIDYRQGKTWGATEQVILQPKLYVQNQPSATTNSSWPSTLAGLYAQIANSDLLRTRVLPQGVAASQSGNYTASAVLDPNQAPLPMVQFDGTGSTPQEAASVTRRATTTLLSYLSDQATQNQIPLSQRVTLQVLSTPFANDATVVKGRKLTIPIVIFLAVLIVTFGLAYLLENLFPAVAVARPGRAPLVEHGSGPAESTNGDDAALEEIESLESPAGRAAVAGDSPRR